MVGQGSIIMISVRSWHLLSFCHSLFIVYIGHHDFSINHVSPLPLWLTTHLSHFIKFIFFIALMYYPNLEANYLFSWALVKCAMIILTFIDLCIIHCMYPMRSESREKCELLRYYWCTLTRDRKVVYIKTKEYIRVG